MDNTFTRVGVLPVPLMVVSLKTTCLASTASIEDVVIVTQTFNIVSFSATIAITGIEKVASEET